MNKKQARCPDCNAFVHMKGYRCRPCGARKRHAQGNGVKRQPDHHWNRRRKVLPGVADGSGCIHHFLLPTPGRDVDPLGICRKCGTKRMHTNVGTGLEKFESPWRSWRIGNGSALEDNAFRLPPGYHLAGAVG